MSGEAKDSEEPKSKFTTSCPPGFEGWAAGVSAEMMFAYSGDRNVYRTVQRPDGLYDVYRKEGT